MQFIVVTRPKAEFLPDNMPSDFVELLRKEEAHSRELYHQGVLRQSWSIAIEGTGAICLFEAGSLEEMKRIWEGFPLIKAGYGDWEILPIAPDPGLVVPDDAPGLMVPDAR